MAYIPVPNTLGVELVFFNATTGQFAENTLYFVKATDWTVGESDDMAALLTDWWIDNLQALTAATWNLSLIRTTELESASGFAREYPVDQDGGAGSAALPGNVTVAISFRTAFRGRSFRGRNYFVGLTEAQVTNDTVVDTTVTALRTAYEVLADLGITLGAQHAVVSRYALGVPRVTGIATIVLSYLVNNTIDSQRRRLSTRGA